MAVTLRDIAEQVDMSISAVSLVLGNKPNRISKEKQTLIRKTAADMNYTFEMPGKTQKNGAKLIGAIFPDSRNLHYSSMVSVIGSIANTRGCRLVTCFSRDTVIGDIDSLNTLIDIGADAIIFCPSVAADDSDMIKYLEILDNYHKPVVFAERYYDFSTNYSTIAINRKKGIYLAMNHLLGLGHKKIAIISSRTDKTRKSVDRIKPALNIDASVEITYFDGDDTPLSGYDAAEEIAKSNVTAVFCCDDGMALGVYKRFHELKIRIPDDISIVGTNDIYYSRCMETPLTSLCVLGDRYGFQIAERLFAEIEDPKIQKSVTLLDPVLQIRASTSAPKK